MIGAGDVYHVTDLVAGRDGQRALERRRRRCSPTRGENGDAPGPLRGTVALTEVGWAVLAGRADRVALGGIDRWLGGVHLQRTRGLALG